MRQAAASTVTVIVLLVAASAASAATTVRTFSPIGDDGTLRTGLTVNHGNTPGDCSASYIEGRAYRCFEGDRIHDPCFVDTRTDDASSVLCLSDPWSRTAIRLDVLDTLPDPGSFRTTPWALELVSGLRCGYLSGSTGAIGRFRLNYGCTTRQGKRTNRVLYGSPNKTRATWTIRQADSFTSRSLKRVAIRTAWR